MDSFLENAHRIFEVARTAGSEQPRDFALLVKTDGGLHFLMDTPFSLEAAAGYAGARSAYRITRSIDGIRVQGQRAGRNGESEECVLESRSVRRDLLRDLPLYRISSPLLISGSGAG
ncbi:MAG: hypothetical protein M3N93_09160 [Acidobacteriota bacterium]|nr:hypothetical protein [Acidobacteriota bacterium]